MAILSVPGLLHVGAAGELEGRTGVKQSRISDLAGCYADGAAFERLAAARGSDIAYEVHEFRPERVAPHELIFGTSILQPGRVGDEFFMTRGHIHARADRPEVYVWRSGRGVLHLEAPDGTTHPLEMSHGSIAYVPAFWIHRSVNIGPEPFVTTFCYPADSGQDYAIIEKSAGMRTLIVDDGAGGWMEAENPRYQPRAPAEQRRYLPEAVA
jgi:glucose-6-phosphate isomerase